MISGRCPICSKSFKIDKMADLKSFPFCSERCRTIDLACWSDGQYAIPGRPAKPAPENGEPTSITPDEDE
jgi:endogenous inhibitor of DNA gyrase (YacG/DUF329 family)